MTREELQQELRELSEEKERAIREHDAKLLEIQEKQQESLQELNEKKFRMLSEIVDGRLQADAAMRKALAEEKTQYKLECMRIENKRQQFFADYKAQSPDENQDTASVWK